MALRYLFDENARGALWHAIVRHNAIAPEPLDVVGVGDVDDLPLRSADPDILRWAEREGRVLVTLDHNTMPAYLIALLGAGGHLPGMFLVRRGSRIRELVGWLALAAQSGDDDQWRDQVIYIP
jgi:Domain of unknown function (DUF5615)